MNKKQLRGKIFEIVLKYYLKNHGYTIIPENVMNYYGVSRGHNGLNVRGRGGNHQIDALGQFEFQIPFVYPIRLLSEAKCRSAPIGIPIIRDFVGVLKDISENYFIKDHNNLKEKFRFTDCGAIFSTSNFSKPAQMYAYAQGIYLVPVKELLPIVDEIVGEIQANSDNLYKTFEDTGIYRRLDEKNKFAYFGVASGLYPLMIVSEKELSSELFEETDDLDVKIYYEYGGRNKEIIYFTVEAKNWKGRFQLPKYIWEKYMNSQDFRIRMINMKEQILNQIDIPLKIKGIRRIVRLKLDQSWIDILRNGNIR